MNYNDQQRTILAKTDASMWSPTDLVDAVILLKMHQQARESILPLAEEVGGNKELCHQAEKVKMLTYQLATKERLNVSAGTLGDAIIARSDEDLRGF